MQSRRFRVGINAALLGGIVVIATAAPARAHGLEITRSDPALPLEVFLAGSAVVIVATFLSVGRMWKAARWQALPPVVPLPDRGTPALVVAARWGGLAGLALVIAGLAQGDAGIGAPAVLVWIVFWLAVPFAGALVGDLWTEINPFRTLAGQLDLGAIERPELLARFGVWPGAVVFLLFAWFELVYPDSGSGRALAIAALVYLVYAEALIVFAGRDTGLQMGEAFTTYNRMISALAPRGRRRDGRRVRRGWFRSLAVLPRWRGLAAFAIFMIGTVSYDGLSSTLWWRDRLAELGFNASTMPVATAGLIGITAMIGMGYWLACVLAAAVAGDGRTPESVASSFAHTLVPIALAYAFAHYFTLVLFEGQLLLTVASDPFALGWDLFGTATRLPDIWLSSTVIWNVQVAAILGGHVLAVVLAHDRALAEFPPRAVAKSQYAMVAIMVVLTGFGLSLLAAG